MKKKILVSLFFSCVALFASAQLKVLSDGSSTSSNITSTGIMGYGKGGVITVKSDRIHPYYSPGDPYGLRLICADAQSSPNVLTYSSFYKNLLTFYVTAEGRIYASKGVLQTSATPSLSRSSRTISSPLEKLKTLHATVYDDPVLSDSSVNSGMDSLALFSADPGIAEEKSERFGLIAQEVEKVFPEVVRSLPDGSKGILYADLIPVLIESIKELQEQVEQLKTQLNASQNAPSLSNNTTFLPNRPGQDRGELYQNTPNPFNKETKIAYRLPAGSSSAAIYIYSIKGEFLKKYPLSISSFEGELTVPASDFSAGIYIYSLVIDNQVLDSKRMTLTE